MTDQKFELNIDISIRDYHGNGNLNIRESVMIPVADFAEMATILGEFHKVAKKIKEARDDR